MNSDPPLMCVCFLVRYIFKHLFFCIKVLKAFFILTCISFFAQCDTLFGSAVIVFVEGCTSSIFIIAVSIDRSQNVVFSCLEMFAVAKDIVFFGQYLNRIPRKLTFSFFHCLFSNCLTDQPRKTFIEVLVCQPF